MSNNILFEQEGKLLFGTVFGYAVQYHINKEYGVTQVRFEGNLVMPDDPQNWKMPMPVDLVSECIFALREKEASPIIVTLYGRLVIFNNEKLFEIKKLIREIQMSLVKVDPDVSNDVRQFIQNGIFDLIRWMPVR